MTEQTPATPGAQPTPPPQWSPDGRYWWNGINWIEASQAPNPATPAQRNAPGSIKWGAGLMVVQGALICLVQLLILSSVITEYGLAGSIPARLLVLALGIADLVFGIGLYTRRYWAWIGGLTTQALGIGVGLFVIGLPLVIYAVIVLVLLTRPSARSWLSPIRR